MVGAYFCFLFTLAALLFSSAGWLDPGAVLDLFIMPVGVFAFALIIELHQWNKRGTSEGRNDTTESSH
jgi:hypothetical protein